MLPRVEGAGHLAGAVLLSHDEVVLVLLDHFPVARVTGGDEERLAVGSDALVLRRRQPDRLVAAHVVALAEVRDALERRIEPSLRRADLLVRVATGRLVLGARLFVPGRHGGFRPRRVRGYTSG